MSLHTLQEKNKVIVLAPPVNTLEKEVLVRAFEACDGFIFEGKTMPKPASRFHAEGMCNIVLNSGATNPIVILLRPTCE